MSIKPLYFQEKMILGEIMQSNTTKSEKRRRDFQHFPWKRITVEATSNYCRTVSWLPLKFGVCACTKLMRGGV